MGQVLNIRQGTDEWKAIRTNYFTASEAAAMLGYSKHMSRDDLLKYKTTQEEAEVTRFQQMIFDKGHAVEDAARPLAEGLICDELYPVVIVHDEEGLQLLASMDGVTITGETGFEHKQWNKELAKQVESGLIPDSHWPQLEHQLLVSGAEEILFAVSDGTKDNFVHCFYKSQAGRRRQLIMGWQQFQKDLENYKPVTYAEAPEPEQPKALPAIMYNLNGLSVTSNLDAYKDAAKQLIEDSKKPLATDQDFADREALCKSFKESEQKIKLIQEQLLAETGDINEFITSLNEISASIRQARLNGERQVKSRKEQIRGEIIEGAESAYCDAISETGLRVYLILPRYDFWGAIKGKRTIKSLHEAVNDLLAEAKIEINEQANKVRANLALLDEQAEFKALFADKRELVQLDTETLRLTIKDRIREHKEAEEKRLTAERERIRREEAERAERAERQARIIDDRITKLRIFSTEMTGKSSSDIGRALNSLKFHPPMETDFQERYDEAKAAHEDAITKLEAMEKQAKQVEAMEREAKEKAEAEREQKMAEQNQADKAVSAPEQCTAESMDEAVYGSPDEQSGFFSLPIEPTPELLLCMVEEGEDYATAAERYKLLAKVASGMTFEQACEAGAA